MSLDSQLSTLFIDMINDEIGNRCRWEFVTNIKIIIFYVYFFNMDISLIMALIFLRICIHGTKVCLEGRVSQNFNIGLSFCFMLCRRWNF